LGEKNMTKVFIEAGPKGGRRGALSRTMSSRRKWDRVLKTFKTQEEQITWAKSEGHSTQLARVRHLNDKKIPNHWRPV